MTKLISLQARPLQEMLESFKYEKNEMEIGLYKGVTSTETNVSKDYQLQRTKTGIYNTSIMYEHSTKAGRGNTKRDCCKVLGTIQGLV